jgi:hypothetical protein
MGLQNYTLLKRYQEDSLGKMRSVQNFLTLSLGAFDWLSLDLKGGAGDIRQHPNGQSEIDYEFNFAGGYGFRMRLFEKINSNGCGDSSISASQLLLLHCFTGECNCQLPIHL